MRVVLERETVKCLDESDFCPNCGSEDMDMVQTIDTDEMILIIDMGCPKCGDKISFSTKTYPITDIKGIDYLEDGRIYKSEEYAWDDPDGDWLTIGEFSAIVEL